MTRTPVLSIVGRSGSGKTTLLERLIPELRRRGYRVAAVKHHRQPGLEPEMPGKDTWRLGQAGADPVILATPDMLWMRKRLARELSLQEVADGISDVDLILAEGFKEEDAPKIQVSCREEKPQLVCDPQDLIAIVSDQPFGLDVPQFHPEDIAALADQIVAAVLRR